MKEFDQDFVDNDFSEIKDLIAMKLSINATNHAGSITIELVKQHMKVFKECIRRSISYYS